MPVVIRATGSSLRRRKRAQRTLTATLCLTPVAAHAAATVSDSILLLNATIQHHEYAAFALTVGIIMFAVLCAALLVRTRLRAAADVDAHQHEISLLQGAIERANTLINSEPQVLVMWPPSADHAEITGDPGIIAAADASLDVLDFDRWLEPEPARALARAVETLRARGEAFSLPLQTTGGKPIEAEGRIVGGRAVLRLREVSGVARRLAEAVAENRKLQQQMDALRVLADSGSFPIWMRDDAGRLAYVNQAYATAVESTPAEVVTRSMELLDHGTREELKLGIAGGTAYSRRVPAVVAGQRRAFDVLSIPVARGSVAIAIDASEAESLRAEIKRMIDAHRSTLDQLSTAVAIFDAQRRLSFYNAAYRALWDLDAAFLDQLPSDTAILDHLRAARRLPEQQDFKQWRTQLQEAYQAVEARQYEWHLPDGRTLRVVTTPNPEGGVTYLFDDVTERLDLVRRFDALIRVQGETLDNLGEAVAVFASDGRLRLSNPAFARMWRFELTDLADRPHIEAIMTGFRKMTADEEALQLLRASVTALDVRAPIARRIERNDGSILDCSAQPLPDGATLVTFIDVTASVNVERALVDRNEALVAADNLKEAFLQHMSYELRSPLTNIIGFAYFLGDQKTGDLNDRQREYLGYITYSTNALLAIVDNILDLTTIEAGAMTLDLGPIDIRKTMQAAAEGVQDRLVKDGISLELRSDPEVGTFVADERRVRQVLFNLLSNAVGFSPPGGTVTLAVDRRPDAVSFSVSDQGPGISEELKDKVFEWFETHSHGSRHRGVGLGLSLVRSFVELHGGAVTIDSVAGQGTTVTCTFPHKQESSRTAAA
jgi:signal transduction histidine kinase